MKSPIGVGGVNEIGLSTTAQNVPNGTQRNKISEAQDALTVLGYNRTQVMAVLSSIDTASLSLEDIIKVALKKLM